MLQMILLCNVMHEKKEKKKKKEQLVSTKTFHVSFYILGIFQSPGLMNYPCLSFLPLYYTTKNFKRTGV